MRKLSPELRELLARATGEYEDQLSGSPAVEYLTKKRGLSEDSATYFRLGYVGEPLEGHKKFAGRLVIPYITKAGVVGMKFRCIEDHECKAVKCPKYLSLDGGRPRIFNVNDLSRPEIYIVTTEGEIDAMTSHQAGMPTVGFPGVSSWRDHFGACFRGYSKIYALTDADDTGQGQQFGEKLAQKMDDVEPVAMPAGHDVNSFYVAAGGGDQGAEALRGRIGLK